MDGNIYVLQSLSAEPATKRLVNSVCCNFDNQFNNDVHCAVVLVMIILIGLIS